MRVCFLLFCVVLTLVFFSSAMAEESICYKSAISSETPNTWKTDNQGKLDGFWCDFSGNQTPDIYLAMYNDRYRQVQIDENGDGAADEILLLDQEKGYFAYTNANGDGYWQSLVNWEYEPGKSTPSKAKKMLLSAVERRIFIDEHPDLWKPCQASPPQPGFPSAVAFQSYRVTIRLTKMAASLKKDPQRQKKPLALPEIKLVVTPGSETNYSIDGMRINNDLLFEGRPAKSGSLNLNLFALPYSKPIPDGSPVNGAMFQISGTLDIEGSSKAAFCSLITWLKGSTFSSTVPLFNAAGKESGSMFIEIFLTDKRHP